MIRVPLFEYVSPEVSNASMITEDITDSTGRKNLYLKGICIQGGIKNANGRTYPTNEIRIAVQTLADLIKKHNGVPGEADHPADLKINLDRISHIITDMWMEGSDGYGKLKILPTPMGNLIRTMLEAGVKLGVSSRGTGNVNEGNGQVSDFEIVTVDIVAQPSAWDAYPKMVYESFMNTNGGNKLFEMARDPLAQKYFKNEMLHFIEKLKL